jgi:hypothetical protein
MATDLRDLALTPRAVAVLVCLRKGPRSVASIADAIGDSTIIATRDLLRLLSIDSAQDATGHKLVREGIGSQRATYGLTHDGLGWLQSHGLDATPAAKQALYAAAAPDLVPGGAL